jgi:hypothetical protein
MISQTFSGTFQISRYESCEGQTFEKTNVLPFPKTLRWEGAFRMTTASLTKAKKFFPPIFLQVYEYDSGAVLNRYSASTKNA